MITRNDSKSNKIKAATTSLKIGRVVEGISIFILLLTFRLKIKVPEFTYFKQAADCVSMR